MRTMSSYVNMFVFGYDRRKEAYQTTVISATIRTNKLSSDAIRRTTAFPASINGEEFYLNMVYVYVFFPQCSSTFIDYISVVITVNWISELLTKAESVAEVPEPSEGTCSCSGYNRGSESGNFHCPTVEGVETADQKHFQWHLYKGQPVIIPNVLNRTTGLSWEPLVMWRASRKIKSTHDLRILEFSVTNCLNLLLKEKRRMFSTAYERLSFKRDSLTI
ncbi:hypothetical protein MIMGU_mgv1a019532mg [Erythranthe guttata]|uniref:Uncharacterized protein n=1 Tax=Erythranthe guttata TaxID=4155 RepID=A0A022RJM2_ERYGU|nr:hypothetical protein MIMGU_mgv1a019532mg [Erythranthe guttata]